MKPYLFLPVFILLAICCKAQSDVVLTADTLLSDSLIASPEDSSVVKERKHSPKLAGGLSAALPGLGQAYNKKYWKIPIVYAGFAATGYCVYHFHKEYASYRDEYRNRLNGDTGLLNLKWEGRNTDNINASKIQNQRYMQISIMVLAVWYFVNILDAVVDAHLMSYDISDNLALHLTPDLKTNHPLAAQTIGLTLTLNLK